jgi:hypothetical protein
MNTFKKALPALAVAAALGAGMAGSAHAGVMGQTVLEITNFRFLNPNDTIINTNQFDAFVFQDSSLGTAILNGAIASQSVNSNAFGTLDLPQQCVGQCVFGPNDYSHRLPPPTLNVARADTLLQGAPVTNPAGVPTPADAHLVTEAQLSSITGAGNVQANLGLTATFSFSLANDQAVTIAFDSLSHLLAHVGLDERIGSTARSSEGWNIELRNSAGGLVFEWSPNGQAGGITGGTENADTCDLQRTVNAQLPGQTSLYDCAGTHSATTGILDADEFYVLGLRHEGATDITRLPEPGSLLLLSTVLGGIGFVARRRKAA